MESNALLLRSSVGFIFWKLVVLLVAVVVEDIAEDSWGEAD
jgi:hypothetical protein